MQLKLLTFISQGISFRLPLSITLLYTTYRWWFLRGMGGGGSALVDITVLLSLHKPEMQKAETPFLQPPVCYCELKHYFIILQFDSFILQILILHTW